MKLCLVIDYVCYDSVGIDLVVMCVNDLIVQGVELLFFLDYYVIGKLNVDIVVDVVIGIGVGCELVGCVLIGGEIVEMLGMYYGDDYDIVGFCVGVVEVVDVIDGIIVKVGQKIIVLGFLGFYLNGYLLICKIIEVSGVDVMQLFDDKLIIDYLFVFICIYVKLVFKLLESVKVFVILYIIGGGFWENILCVLFDNVKVVIDGNSWEWLVVFNWL